MTKFRTTRNEQQIELAVKTSAKLTSFNGTSFVPNHVETRVFDGRVVSLTFDRTDENGWIDEDPGGPDGAVLSASFGGGEIDDNCRTKLPKVAQDALAAVEEIVR